MDDKKKALELLKVVKKVRDDAKVILDTIIAEENKPKTDQERT